MRSVHTVYSAFLPRLPCYSQQWAAANSQHQRRRRHHRHRRHKQKPFFMSSIRIVHLHSIWSDYINSYKTFVPYTRSFTLIGFQAHTRTHKHPFRFLSSSFTPSCQIKWIECATRCRVCVCVARRAKKRNMNITIINCTTGCGIRTSNH